MKRWINWASSEDLHSHSQPAVSQPASQPLAPSFEPTQKRHRSMNLKASMKSLFKSVKKIIPGSQRQSKQSSESYSQGIQKSAAMREADDFLARLGGQWKAEDLEGRIAYLYKVVDDSFERVHKEVKKGNVESTSAPSAVVKEYLREIRALQALLATCPKPVEKISSLPHSHTFYPQTQIEPLNSGHVISVRSRSDVDFPPTAELECIQTIDEIDHELEDAMDCEEDYNQVQQLLENIIDDADGILAPIVNEQPAIEKTEDISHLNDVQLTPWNTTYFKPVSELASSFITVPKYDITEPIDEIKPETSQIVQVAPIEALGFHVPEDSPIDHEISEDEGLEFNGYQALNQRSSTSSITQLRSSLENLEESKVDQNPGYSLHYRDVTSSSLFDIFDSTSSASLLQHEYQPIVNENQLCTKTGALVSVDRLIDQFNANTVLTESKPSSRRHSLIARSSSSVLPSFA